MKKLLSFVLALTMCLVIASPAYAFDASKAGVYTTVSAHNGNTAAIDQNGTLWLWGFNRTGQLGIGTTGDENRSGVPVKVMEDVVSVSQGALFTAAIKEDGSLWMWGANDYGQLGNGTRTDSAVPVKVMDDVAAVSCGRDVTAAIKTDGSLWMWGLSSHHELANGGDGNAHYYSNGKLIFTYQNLPIKVMDNVVAVSCGRDMVAAIKTDGTLWTWGQFNSVFLGNGSKEGSKVPVKIMDDVSSVVCGDEACGAIKTDGSLWMWGYGLRNGAFDPALVPVKVMENVAAISLFASMPWGAILKTDGTLWMWGNNEWAQLGIGSYGHETDSDVPVKVLDNVVAVSCGSLHTAALKADGTLWTWGDNSHGQLGNNWLGTIVTYEWVDYQLVSTPTKMMENVALPNSTTVSIPVTVAGFSDVYEDDYYADAVVWAKETGVTGGTSATTFSPGSTVTRAQAVTFLWRAAGSPEPAAATSPFTDVTDTGAYYYDAVLWATEQGITGGVGNNRFSVDGTLTYDQMLAMLCRAAGDTTTGDNWSAAAVAWAKEHGLTNGLNFGAKNSCPRSDVVYCLWKQLAY